MKESLNDPTSGYGNCPTEICLGALATCAWAHSLRESRDEDRKGPSDIKDEQTVSFIITDQSQFSQLSTLAAQAALCPGEMQSRQWFLPRVEMY